MMSLGYGGMGMVVMVIFWVAIVGLAVLFLSALFPAADGSARRGPEAQTGAASGRELNALNERYARGEISKAEYEELRRALKA